MKKNQFPTQLASMQAELQQWSEHNHDDYELTDWLAAVGNFDLAAGYAALFCPNIIELDNCLLTIVDTMDEADAQEIRKQKDKKALERDWNCVRLWDFHPAITERELTAEKAVFIGQRLQHIYTARLMMLFPDYPCRVEFHQPENPDDVYDYFLSFWQIIHEPSPYTDSEKALIDETLLKYCRTHWLKTALVLFEAQFALEDTNTTFAINADTSVFFTQRLIALAEQGQLLVQGNLRRPGFSEIKLP